MVEKEEFYLNSTNGVNKLHVILWHPLRRSGRLFRFPMACVNMWIVATGWRTFPAQHGMMVIGNDHLGHGGDGEG